MNNSDTSEHGKKKPAKSLHKVKKGDFCIRDFPDLRTLRKGYLYKGDKPIGVDSTENPAPDEQEEDFGLTRSTPEQAWDFYRKSLEEDCGDDPLTEFLDDK